MKIVHDIPFLHRENDKQQEERQSQWKPSEEQMDALDNARFCKAYDRTELDSLYEQLNKLFCL